MRPLLAAAAFCFLALPASAGSTSNSLAGTTTADFLNLPVGAKAVAMGTAYGSVADDATALYWNPADMTRVEHNSVTAMHALYIDSSYFDYASFAQNLGNYGAWGLGAQYFSAGSITETDPTGTAVGTYSPYDLAVSAGYAFKLRGVDFMPDLNGFSLGASVKFIQSKILANAHTEAADLGLLSPGYLDDRLRFAFTATNLGGKMTFEQQRELLPVNLRFGGSFKITKDWLISTDGVFPNNDAAYGAVGTEYWLATGSAWKFAGRAGYNSQTVGGVTGVTGASFGFGLGYKGASFDYAFVPFGGLGQAQLLSLTYNF